MLHSIKNSNDIDMSISSKANAIWQFYLCDQLQFTDLQNMKINSFLYACLVLKTPPGMI